MNRATCVAKYEDDDYHCACAAGYVGKHCEIGISTRYINILDFFIFSYCYTLSSVISLHIFRTTYSPISEWNNFDPRANCNLGVKGIPHCRVAFCLCQNEFPCETIHNHMKMCSVCIFISMQIKLIFISKVSHEEPF